MLLEDLECIIPINWQPMDLYHEKYKVVKIPPNCQEYEDTIRKVVGPYYSSITGVFKLQNPELYTKFRIKAHEYENRGPYDVKWLFHDTARENTQSIAVHNFDWRHGQRFMFGPGVYFSVSPYLANKHSSRQNGLFRTMFIAEVLVQNVQLVLRDIFLPDFGYDTVLCHNGATYVKYFDSEFYPHYFIDYISKE